MGQPSRIAALVLLAALAGCGKMGPPDTPPNSTYPKGYPEGSISKPLPGLVASGGSGNGTKESTTTTTVTPVTTNNPTFTKNGAWIDPNMRRPTIDPKADEDKWDLQNSNITFSN
ncbi:MAG TPA: hypothetical protein VGG27_02400 [Magnetospirillaceae bacterium]